MDKVEIAIGKGDLSVLSFVSNPTISLTIKETGIIMLPVTGTLLGLVYAALIYWLQGGLSKLEYSKTLLEDLMIADAKILLDLLIGSSILSLFAIFETRTLMDISFWLFVLFFTRDLLNLVAEQGYITTLFSKKFIPAKYGPFRQYLRKLKNAGLAGWLRPLFLITIVVIYPICISIQLGSLWSISSKSIILFIFLSCALALLQTKSLLTQAFDVKKNLERELMKENEEKATKVEDKTITWTDKKRKVEQKIISERLESIGVVSFMEVPQLIRKDKWTSRDLDEKPVLDGIPLIKDHGSLHLNITIPYLTSDIETREFIFMWTQLILQTLAASKTEVSHYSLSFFRKDPKSPGTHFGIIRASRNEVNKALSQHMKGEDFIRSLSGRYLTEAVAEF